MIVLFGSFLSLFLNIENIYAQKSFVVIVLTYNNQKYCIENIESILAQDYDNFRVIIINDCSNDQTGKLLDEYIKKYDTKKRVTLIHNTVRCGSMLNHYNAAHMCKPDEIIVHVDGDDFLPVDGKVKASSRKVDTHVLKTLNTIYSNRDVWLTYGQYVTYPKGEIGLCEAFPKEIIQHNLFRNYKWVSSHLRTFYAGLFHKIKLEDFMDTDGKPFTCCPDVAFMLPLLEMAGKHVCFIPDIMYIYNMANPLNEFNFDLNNRLRIDRVIRTRPKYQPLNNLNF